MLDIGTCLRHYKRQEVQEAMLATARSREVAVKYGDKGFGKRPDVLLHPRDVLEFAKKGVTSFHASEERWSNPLVLAPGMKPQELSEARIGFDLVLDVDCPDWELSKIITWLLITALKQNGVRSISCKFSGNKGFHIGVPFEAFPRSIEGKETAGMFPDICRKISFYLMKYIGERLTMLDENSEVIFGGIYRFPMPDIAERLSKPAKELTMLRCTGCGKEVRSVKPKYEHTCNECSKVVESNDDYMTCCGSLMDKKPAGPSCSCGSSGVMSVFDPLGIIEVDTVLISARHMYRMVYSLHEKSGNCSIPIDPDKVLLFEKAMAKSDGLILPEFRFLDAKDASPDETASLIAKSMRSSLEEQTEKKPDRVFEELTEEISPDYFPPCMNLILQGLDDGKKRAAFVLTNFFSSTGYGWDKIEIILDSWNAKNKEKMRDVLLNGQLRYRKAHGKVLPPNCDNKGYYPDMGVCKPDSFCPRIKNPVNYAVLKHKAANPAAQKRQKLTEEQKEMRRKFREQKKGGIDADIIN